MHHSIIGHSHETSMSGGHARPRSRATGLASLCRGLLMAALHDVVLVGGGGAGLRAAIALAEINPQLSVAVVSKVYPMRSHTVSAEGGAAGVVRPDDTLDEHAY